MVIDFDNVFVFNSYYCMFHLFFVCFFVFCRIMILNVGRKRNLSAFRSAPETPVVRPAAALAPFIGYPCGITSFASDESVFDHEQPWDVDNATFTFLLGNLERLCGPTIKLSCNNYEVRQYQKNLLWLLGRNGNACIFVNRTHEDLASRQKFVDRLVNSGFIARNGDMENMVAVPTELPSQIVSSCLQYAGFTHGVHRWYGGKISLSTARKYWDPLSVVNPHCIDTVWDIGCTFATENIVTVLPESTYAVQDVASVEIFEMLNGITGNLNLSVGGSCTFNFHEDQVLQKVVIYPHLVHVLKKLTMFQWDNASNFRQLHGRKEMLKKIHVLLSTFRGYMGGFRYEARWKMLNLTEFPLLNESASFTSFLNITGLSAVNFNFLLIPMDIYFRNSKAFMELLLKRTGRNENVLPRETKEILAATYNAFGMNMPYFKKYLYRQDDASAMWKTIQLSTLTSFGMFYHVFLDANGETAASNPAPTHSQVACILAAGDSCCNGSDDFESEENFMLSNLAKKLKIRNHPKKAGFVCWMKSNGGCGPAYASVALALHDFLYKNYELKDFKQI